MIKVIIQSVERRNRTRQIIESLIDYPFEVNLDTGGNSWTGLQGCLEKARKNPQEYTMILQDDILVCRDFIPAAEKIIKLLPNEFITFFSPNPITQSMFLTCFARIKVWYFAQAYCFPTFWIDEFLEFNKNVVDSLYNDDVRWAIFLLFKKKYAHATVPSLVEHICWKETTLNKHERSTMAKYKVESRIAQNFIGIESSALDIDWRLPEKFRTDDTGSLEQFMHKIKDPTKLLGQLDTHN